MRRLPAGRRIQIFWAENMQRPFRTTIAFPFPSTALSSKSWTGEDSPPPHTAIASWAPAKPLSKEALAHDPVFSGTVSEKMQREIGLPWSPALVERARYIPRGTLEAAKHVL